MSAFEICFSGTVTQGVLLSVEDLAALFKELEPFEFYNVSSVQTHHEPKMTSDDFLEFYQRYLEALFSNQPLVEEEIRKMFSWAIASSKEAFHRQELPSSRFLLKPKRAVIQWQPLGLFISSLDKKIHTKTFAKQVQSFGVKWSFAHIYEIKQEHKVVEVGPGDPEWEKFMVFRRFVRQNTEPLQLRLGSQREVYPFRFSSQLKSRLSGIAFFKEHQLEVVL